MTEPLPPDAARGVAGGRLIGNLNRFAGPRSERSMLVRECAIGESNVLLGAAFRGDGTG
jgi:hypothetical protein